MTKAKVVILGAGYAGLRALNKLQKHKDEVTITLVDQNDYHYEATDLHEVAAGSVSPSKITYPIQDVVRPEVTTFVQDTVIKIDPAEKKVILQSSVLTYDYLIIALGFVSETFGVEGAKEHAFQMTTVPEAEAIREHIMTEMLAYREDHDPQHLRVIVCGAGFTGIELLGALSDEKWAYGKAAGVAPEEIEFYCVESATRLLNMFDEDLASYGVTHLEKWGVHLLTNQRVTKVSEGEITYTDKTTAEERQLRGGTIIWTTGVSGSPVIAASGFAEKRGRVMVADDLSAPGFPEVFIIGDCSAVMDPETDHLYPTTAQISLKMGEAAGKNILLTLKGAKTEKFRFHSLGSVCSIGNTHAFGLVGKVPVKGYPASFVKKAIMDRSLLKTGGVKEMMAKGRFDLYH